MQQVTCDYCGAEFTVKESRIKRSKSGRLFCCREHLEKAKKLREFSDMVPEHYRKNSSFKLKQCLNCGISLEKFTGRVYCSRPCQANYRQEKALLTALITGYFVGNAATIKRLVVRNHGHKCSVCGLEEWCGQPAPLVMDHIDGNSDNWSVENLRLVCGNCDMQLPTYKSKNKGNGRHSRKQRYAEGKSY